MHVIAVDPYMVLSLILTAASAARELPRPWLC